MHLVFSLEHEYGASDGVICHMLVILIMVGVGILLISHLYVWLTLGRWCLIVLGCQGLKLVVVLCSGHSMLVGRLCFMPKSLCER